MKSKIILCCIDKEGCWIWQGSKTIAGYPVTRQFNPRRKTLLTRVILAAKLNRPLKSRMGALHKCDKPSCVKPECLWEGTPSQNIKDCVSKGRHRYPIIKRDQITGRFLKKDGKTLCELR